MMDAGMESPRLVASTDSVYSCSIKESGLRESRARHEESPSSSPTAEDKRESNYFKSIQWSPDGTSLLSSSADNKLRYFVVPPDLLSASAAHSLTPYTSYTAPEPVYAQAFHPSFSLSDPSSTVLLASLRDHPIQLINVLAPSPSPIATYPLISPTTEEFLAPSSLLFQSSGNAFFTGTDCLISIFDISRLGEGPATRLPTIPSKRHKMKGGGVGMRGIVSCLALQPESVDMPAGSGMLAAGTWTRWVSLYDAGGMGGTVANWSIAPAADEEAGIGGAGVSQVLWSSCGRYLFVVERKSQGVLVYDVRVTGKLVAWIEGREAATNQRMTVDVASGDAGAEIWAGGSDGKVRMWRDVGAKEGGVQPSMEWLAHEPGTAVGGIGMHSCGSVLATVSGMRREDPLDLAVDDASDSSSDDSSSASSGESEDEDDSFTSESSTSSTDEASQDNSIKIWNL